MKKMVKQAAVIAMLAGFAMLVLGCASSARSRGNRAFRSGDYELAIAEFSEALSLQPGCILTRKDRGIAYLRTGDPERAISDLETAQRIARRDLRGENLAWFERTITNELAEARRQQQQQARASAPAPTQPQLVQAHATAPRQQQPAQAPATATVPGVGVTPVPAAVVYSQPVRWTVNNAAEWIEAVNGIRGGGNNMVHFINLNGTFPVVVTPDSEFTFGSVTDIAVIIYGRGTISQSSSGNWLRIGPRQYVTLAVTPAERDDNRPQLIVSEGGSTYWASPSVRGSRPVYWAVGNAAGWIEAVNGIRGSGNNMLHFIRINGTFPVIVTPSSEFTFGSVTGTDIIIHGSGAISPSTNGSLLRIGSGQTIVISDLTLQGRDDNNTRLVVAVGGSSLRMLGNATVTGNSSGGVSVVDGLFIMQDNAAVSRNNSGGRRGGGVYFSGSGSFIMAGNASVSNNIANRGHHISGGGVYFSGSGYFIMQDNATVSGNTTRYLNNSGGGIRFSGSGNFIMRGNATVSGNSSNDGGGGISFSGGGNFSMRDNASVSGNTTRGGLRGGGGIFFSGIGNFTMQDNAVVSGNTSGDDVGVYGLHARGGSGGGISFDGSGNFTMRDNASVLGNTARNNMNMGGATGGGVSFSGGGNFTMRDNASVSDNIAHNGNRNFIGGARDGGGGGVFFRGGNFIMQDNAVVSGNTSSSSNERAWSGGGGVFVSGVTFTMQNSASVSGNINGGDGGGMFIQHGTFIMEGGTISGNTNSGRGGGAFVTGADGFGEGRLTKTGGTIHGSNEAQASLRNTASRGHAIYQSRPNLWRNATAGPAMNPGTFGFWLNEP